MVCWVSIRIVRQIKGAGIAMTPMLLAGSEIALSHATLRDQKREIFKVLFLDKGLRSFCGRDLFIVTIDEAAVHTRAIVKASQEFHISGLVIVHILLERVSRAARIMRLCGKSRRRARPSLFGFLITLLSERTSISAFLCAIPSKKGTVPFMGGRRENRGCSKDPGGCSRVDLF